MDTRPKFIDDLAHSHADEANNVVALTGNIHDVVNIPGVGYVSLEQGLYSQLKTGYTVLRLDIASGLTAFDTADEGSLLEAVRLANVTAMAHQKLPEDNDLRNALGETQHRPLEALILLRRISEAYERIKTKKANKVKPLCVLIQFAGALFPAGDWDRLSEVAKQELVTFLSIITSPGFVKSDNLFVLISSTMAELNSRIFHCPATAWIEIKLPGEAERSAFAESFISRAPKPVNFGLPREEFIGLTNVLRLVDISDLLEVASRTAAPITRAGTMERVNRAVTDFLGDTVEIKRPEHTPDDIIGYRVQRGVIEGVIARFKDRSTAPAVILSSGPNGVGKTYQWEAYSGTSGFVVIVLKNMRSMWYGETDKLKEKFRFIVETLGRCLFFIDEAHTQFSSIHDKNTQDVEKRLNATFIMMMSDKSLLGKVVWVLMTSRPDLLDPDIKSRAGIQVPTFDLEGDERREFVGELFKRAGFALEDADLDQLLSMTEDYSARDYSYLIQEVRASGKTPVETLEDWQAAASIKQHRAFQSLVAAQACSYRKLLPTKIREMGPEGLPLAIDALRVQLRL